MPSLGPVLSLRQALYRASRDYPGGQNKLALDMGVTPDDLAKRLNPTDSRPIKPELIEEIIGLTRDVRLLAALMRPAGAAAFVPVPMDACRDALKALGELLQNEAEFVGSLHAGAADGEWKVHEVEELRYHANRVVGAVLGIVAGAALAMEGQADG